MQIPELFRTAILGLTDPETLALLQQDAELVRAQIGEYTEATYHFVAGGQPDLALRLWHEYRDMEINHGQGHSAYRIFAPLREGLFNSADQRLFRLIRSELHRLVGEYGSAEANIDAVTAALPDAISHQALIQKADLRYLRNELVGARQA